MAKPTAESIECVECVFRAKSVDCTQSIRCTQCIKSVHLTGNRDTDNLVMDRLSETDFINFYLAAPKLKLFQSDGFWRRRFCQRHGDVPHPRTKTWRELTLHLGWYNWCPHDWFSILGLTADVKAKLVDTVQEFFDRRARIWESGLLAATKKGDRDLIEFFIWKGAENWNDALIAASRNGDTGLIDLFTRYGADNYIDAAYYAHQAGYTELAQELRAVNYIERHI